MHLSYYQSCIASQQKHEGITKKEVRKGRKECVSGSGINALCTF